MLEAALKHLPHVPMIQITHQRPHQLSCLLVVCVKLFRASDGLIGHEFGSKVQLEFEELVDFRHKLFIAWPGLDLQVVDQ